MTPRETVAMLTTYFTEMVGWSCFSHGGMLEQYTLGDAPLMSPFRRTG